MPSQELDQYRAIHAALSDAIVAPPVAVDDLSISFLDDEETRLEAEPEEQDVMIAIDIDTDEVDVAAPSDGAEEQSGETDYAAIIKKAFLDAFEQNRGLEVLRKYEQTLSVPEHWDKCLGGVSPVSGIS